MKITFLGCGGAFSDLSQGQSNIFIQGESGVKMLLDCGTDCRHLLKQQFPDFNNGNISEYIDVVYISHIHADHVGGMEWLGFCTYFNKKSKKLELIVPDEILKELWDTLSGGMAALTGSTGKLEDFFTVHAIKENHRVKISRSMELKLIRNKHVESPIPKISYGLIVTEQGKSAYISTDVLNEEVYTTKLIKIASEVDVIFHDCETTPNRTRVHYHYDDLNKLPADVKSKMYLYHYAPSDKDAQADGFKGFVKKGQMIVV